MNARASINARHPAAILREPVAELLDRHQIHYRIKDKRRINPLTGEIHGGFVWHDFSQCPACGGKGYQCGIGEAAGYDDGEPVHIVICRNVDKNPFADQKPPYHEFLYTVGWMTDDEYQQVCALLKAERKPSLLRRAAPSGPAWKPPAVPPLRVKNPESEAELRKRLLDGADTGCPDAAARAAWEWLTGPQRGLTADTIKRFGLGLTDPYTYSDKVGDENLRGKTQKNCLVAPIKGRDGQFYARNIYYNIPGVSEHPKTRNGWVPSGNIYTYYGAGHYAQTCAFIAEGMKDVWRLEQELAGTRLHADLMILTSTNGTSYATDLPDILADYDVIYFGMDNDVAGNAAAHRFQQEIGREILRVVPPDGYGKDWTDFFNKGGSVEQFEQLLDDAKPIQAEVVDDQAAVSKALALGQAVRLAYRPVRIGTYFNGHLTGTVRTLVIDPEVIEVDGQTVVDEQQYLETVVIRSDRQMLRAHYARAKKNTQLKDRVLRLDDAEGTIIEKEPAENRYSTWDWDGAFGIDAYLKGKSRPRELNAILSDVMRHLKTSVWLPYEEDYALLALTVPVTYAQEIFDAVPYLLLNGPKGSGKTEAGIAMADICANGHLVGKINAANVIRLIDESRGFVCLDDLEGIGEKSPNRADYVELEQALKVGYKKRSATRNWTDVKTNKTEVMYYFGVKMINNTEGVDDILGSRMFRIQTRKMTDEMKEERKRTVVPMEADELRKLRCELHTWTYLHVAGIAAKYKEVHAHDTDREDEIAAPLKVFAELAGDPALSAQFNLALLRQQTVQTNIDDPVEVLKEAVRNLIAQGYTALSPTHVVMEMMNLYDPNFGKTSTTEIPQWAQPEWVGKMMATHDLTDGRVRDRRERLFGKQLRVKALRQDLVDEVRRDLAANGTAYVTDKVEPFAFCQGCASCPYRLANCEIMANRLDAERRRQKPTRH